MGHNPIVVTVDEKYASYNQKDYSLLNEIDNIETYKTKSFDLLKLYSFIKSGNTTKSIFHKCIPEGANMGTPSKQFSETGLIFGR